MDNQTLKSKTAGGLLWGGISNGMQQVLNLIFGIFFARLLSPSEYGMVGMLTIFSLIASTLQESGFTAALTNKPNVEHRDYNAVFWFSTLMGLSLYVILFFCAPLIAAFYHTPDLTKLARVAFLGFFIASSGIAHNAYMFKNLKVKQKSIICMFSLAISGVVGVILAWNGYSYWALVAQSLVYVSSNTILFWINSGWMPSLNIDFSPLKGMFSFSVRIMLTSIFNTINNNILTVIFGRFYTEREVGLFNQANKWASMGWTLIVGITNGVAQPVLSQVVDDKERQSRVFRKMLRFVAFISFPAIFGLSYIAPELIDIAIGDNWAESAFLMQILCIGAAFVPVSNLFSNLIISRGRSDIFMWCTLILGAIQIMAALLCLSLGITATVICYVIINIAWISVWEYWAKKEIPISFVDVMKDIMPFMLITAGCILVSHYALSLMTINIIVLLVLKIVIVALLYLLTMKLFKVVTFNETIDYLFKRK